MAATAIIPDKLMKSLAYGFRARIRLKPVAFGRHGFNGIEQTARFERGPQLHFAASSIAGPGKMLAPFRRHRVGIAPVVGVKLFDISEL